MKKYLLQWNQGVGPTWNHEFNMHSDAMALDYVNRLCKAEKAMQSATRVYVWSVDPEKLLGAFESQTEVNLVASH